MLKEIIEIVLSLVGHEYLYFDAEVRIEEHGETVFPFYVWAACVSPKGFLYVMDAEEHWTKVSEADEKYLTYMYDRMNRLKDRYSKTVK